MMDDLISRRAVLALPRDRIRNMSGEIVGESIDVADIKALPSAQSRWIPCSKKLPEEDGPYLVSYKWRVLEAVFSDGKWYSIYSNKSLSIEVLAWMPLPEVYKEEQDI